jgi:protein TonB
MEAYHTIEWKNIPSISFYFTIKWNNIIPVSSNIHHHQGELMNFQQGKNKNLTGVTVVAVLHVALLAAFLNGSKLTVFKKTETEVDLVPYVEPPKPKTREPEPPAPVPKDPVIEVPMPPIPIAANDDPKPTGHTVTDDTPPARTGAGADGTVDNGAKTQVKAAPVHVAAVVDAKACVKPEYPKTALRNGDTGVVTLALLIGTDGRVADSKVEKSSGFRELDRAAQVGLGLCKFKPGTLDGAPYQSWTKMQYVWSLDD